MKPVLYLLLTFLSISSFSQTIPLDSFFAPGTTWTEVKYDFNRYSGDSWWTGDGIQYKIERDTMVAGKNCHLLSWTHFAQYSYTQPFGSSNKYFGWVGPDFTHKTIAGWIRTDSNKVYFTSDSAASSHFFTPGIEYLLYDFNLLPGSSLATSGGEHISGVMLDAAQLSDGRDIEKLIGTSSDNYWLYGIGSNNGLINISKLTSFPAGVDEKLLCYDNPYFSYHVEYPDSILPGNLQRNCFDMDSIELEVKNNSRSDAKLKTFPNPLTGDDLHVEIDDESYLSSIVIADMPGKILFTFTKFHKGENILYVPLRPGAYILRSENSDHTSFKQKFIRL